MPEEIFKVIFTRNGEQVYPALIVGSYTDAIETAMNGKAWDQQLTRTVLEGELRKAQFSGEYSSDY